VAASHNPRWFVINEWANAVAAMADGSTPEVLARHEGGLRSRLWRFAYNVGHRRFRLAGPPAA
jgi:hypothetical protein